MSTKTKRKNIGEFQFHLPNVTRIKCPKNCGWYREYSEGDHYENRRIDHPLYGPISNWTLVQLDIKNHDCIEAANAKLRANIRKREADAKRRMASTGRRDSGQ